MANIIGSPGFFINIISEVHNQVEAFFRHMIQRGEVAVLILLAGSKAKAEALSRSI